MEKKPFRITHFFISSIQAFAAHGEKPVISPMASLRSLIGVNLENDDNISYRSDTASCLWHYHFDNWLHEFPYFHKVSKSFTPLFRCKLSFIIYADHVYNSKILGELSYPSTSFAGAMVFVMRCEFISFTLSSGSCTMMPWMFGSLLSWPSFASSSCCVVVLGSFTCIAFMPTSRATLIFRPMKRLESSRSPTWTIAKPGCQGRANLSVGRNGLEVRSLFRGSRVLRGKGIVIVVWEGIKRFIDLCQIMRGF